MQNSRRFFVISRRIVGYFGGGDDRDRTDYLLNAIQALSQVSYAPTSVVSNELEITTNILLYIS